MAHHKDLLGDMFITGGSARRLTLPSSLSPGALNRPRTASERLLEITRQPVRRTAGETAPVTAIVQEDVAPSESLAYDDNDNGHDDEEVVAEDEDEESDVAENDNQEEETAEEDEESSDEHGDLMQLNVHHILQSLVEIQNALKEQARELESQRAALQSLEEQNDKIVSLLSKRKPARASAKKSNITGKNTIATAAEPEEDGKGHEDDVQQRKKIVPTRFRFVKKPLPGSQ